MSYLDTFKNADNFEVRKTEHVDFRYCMANEYIDIKFIEAQYIEKYFEKDTTRSVKTVKAIKFSEWMSRQNNEKNNIDLTTIFDQLQREKKIDMNLINQISQEKNIMYVVSDDKNGQEAIPDQLKIDFLVVKTGATNQTKYFVHSRVAIRYLGDISKWFRSIIEAVFEKYINGELTPYSEKIYIREPNNTITYFDNMKESYIDIDIPVASKSIQILEESIEGLGYLYFIKEIMPYKEDLYLYKVGFSNNPDNRFKSHQCSNSRKLIMYNSICCKDYKDAERYMHQYFSNRRAPLGGGTEWFLLRDNEVDKICEVA